MQTAFEKLMMMGIEKFFAYLVKRTICTELLLLLVFRVYTRSILVSLDHGYLMCSNHTHI